MKLLSHGPEPCASANSAIPAEQYLYYAMPERKASTFFRYFYRQPKTGRMTPSANERTFAASVCRNSFFDAPNAFA